MGVAIRRSTVRRLCASATLGHLPSPTLRRGWVGKFVPFDPQRSDLVDGLERPAHIEQLRPEIWQS